MFEYPTYLVHFGIKGQKWGDRRYQNEDGSWTPEGRIRYGKGFEGRRIRNVDKKIGKIISKYSGEKGEERARKAGSYKVDKDMQKIEKYMNDKRNKGYFKDYEKYKQNRSKYLNSLERKSKNYADKKFNEWKKRDKTLDEYDKEEMRSEAFENSRNFNKEKLDRYVALGFDRKTADIILKASDLRYAAAANYLSKYKNKSTKIINKYNYVRNY